MSENDKSKNEKYKETLKMVDKTLFLAYGYLWNIPRESIDRTDANSHKSVLK